MLPQLGHSKRATLLGSTRRPPDKTSPEEVKELRDVMDSVGLAGSHGVTRFYDKIEFGTVVLSAWGISDTMMGIDEDRVNTFFKTYAGTLGPEGNIPCLNSGVMPPGSTP